MPSFVASGGAWVSDHRVHPAIKGLPRDTLLGLPMLIWCAAAVVVLALVLLRWRREGGSSTRWAATRRRHCTRASRYRAGW